MSQEIRLEEVEKTDEKKIRINEIYLSLLGEGQKAGYPCVLVRTAFCPLRCVWCDTAHTSHFYREKRGVEETLMTIDEVLSEIKKFECKRVLLTGGEPILEGKPLMELAALLHNDNFEILMETSGAYAINEWRDYVDVLDMDIKCPASGMEKANKYDQIDYLRFQDEVKFVVSDEKDVEFAIEVIERYKPKCLILFSPTWESPKTFWPWLWNRIGEYAKKSQFNIRLQIQMHKVVFGNERMR